MPLACLEHCPMTKCPRFFRCEEHWNGDELEEMKPVSPHAPISDIEPVFPEDGPV